MKKLFFAALGLALVGAGCVLTSGQFRLSFELGDVPVGSPSTVVAKSVDLNSIGTYRDHKQDLEGLTDLALLGDVRNNGPQAVDVEAWITTSPTSYATDTEVRANGVRIWGRFHLGVGESKLIDWNQSAGLFDDAGVATLLGEVQGDGVFTIYLIGATGTYAFTVQNGFLVLTLDAGV